MKKFIIKTTLFSLIPFIGLVVIFSVLKNQFREKIEGYPTVLLGDSQTEFISHVDIFNRSIHGCPYFVNYEFANEFIEQLKGKRVYIACNYHNLSKLYQNRLHNDSLYPGWRKNVVNRLDEFKFFNSKHSDLRTKDMTYTFYDNKKPLKLAKAIYSKSYESNSSNSVIADTLSILNTIERHWRHPGYLLDDIIQREYLEKTIDLLKKNKCEVILLKMPLTNFYINETPTHIKDELKHLSKKYNIEILDLDETLSISKNYEYFKDYGHLNISGDSIVNNYLHSFEKKQTHKP